MTYHQSALLNQVVRLLEIKPQEKYIDATLGGAGHAIAILKKGGLLLGIDWDSHAIQYSQKKLAKACPRANYRLVLGNFADLKKIAQDNDFSPVSGIIFDLGPSLYQLKSPSRGFSFLNTNSPLDMRMSAHQSVTAADLIDGLNKGELYALFSQLAQEYDSRSIIKAILVARRLKKIKTTGELVNIIKKIKKNKSKIHPATKIFLALRIAVNDELNNLKKALPQAIELLKKGGKLIVLSYHSGEDRIVKHFFKKIAAQKLIKILTKKPIIASPPEIRKNPISRSAKLRAIEKI